MTLQFSGFPKAFRRQRCEDVVAELPGSGQNPRPLKRM
jgi:hypothetical protein